jgi:hypothetical protein
MGGTVDGLWAFADEQEAMDHLLARLGPPTADDPDHRCDPSLRRPGRTVTWGAFELYVADASSSPSEYEPSEGSYVVGWSYALAPDGTDALALRTEEGVGLGSTVADLRAAYDDGDEFTWEGAVWFEVFRGDVSNLAFRLDDDGTVVAMESGSTCPA